MRVEETHKRELLGMPGSDRRKRQRTGKMRSTRRKTDGQGKKHGNAGGCIMRSFFSCKLCILLLPFVVGRSRSRLPVALILNNGQPEVVVALCNKTEYQPLRKGFVTHLPTLQSGRTCSCSQSSQASAAGQSHAPHQKKFPPVTSY